MCLNLKNIYLVIFVMNQLCEKKMTFKTFLCVCVDGMYQNFSLQNTLFLLSVIQFEEITLSFIDNK